MTATDMRTLGRLGEPLRSTPGFRRRRRFGRPVAIIVAVVTAGVSWLGLTANSQLEEPPSAVAAAASATTGRPSAERASRAATQQAPTFATIDGVELSLVHHDPVAVGFHEGDRAEALPLTPVGRLLSNANPTWTPVPDESGPEYVVLAPAVAARPATGAVDVVVPEGASILAPVTGSVTAVTEYPLYGQTRDWRIVITPTDRPDLAVTLRYVSEPSVAVGDSVTAGKTPLGRARVLPFASPMDAVADAALPRVMMQVQPAVADDAIDPNAPAVVTESAGT